MLARVTWVTMSVGFHCADREVVGDQFCYWNATAGDGDRLAGGDSVEEAGELGFGLGDGNCVH